MTSSSNTNPPDASLMHEADIRFGEFVLRLETQTLEHNGRAAKITAGEYSVLLVLATNPGRTLSREQLSTMARGHAKGAIDRSIDVLVSRVRRLIERDPSRPRHLQTVWGAGYVFLLDERRLIVCQRRLLVARSPTLRDSSLT